MTLLGTDREACARRRVVLESTPMTLKEAMTTLEKAGTAQNRKVYARHGYPANTFGVSFAELGKLKKSIKTDHALACDLWETGNGDARVLATMIADPAAATMAGLEKWAKQTEFHGLADLFAGYVAKTKHAHTIVEKWCGSRTDTVAVTAYGVLARLALDDESLDDAYFEQHLKTIETTIHSRQNRTRHSMNGALIAIGLRNEALRERALVAAKNVGKVEVDHGETDCKTPDAAAYIQKALQSKAKRRRC